CSSSSPFDRQGCRAGCLPLPRGGTRAPGARSEVEAQLGLSWSHDSDSRSPFTPDGTIVERHAHVREGQNVAIEWSKAMSGEPLGYQRPPSLTVTASRAECRELRSESPSRRSTPGRGREGLPCSWQGTSHPGGPTHSACPRR